MKSFTTRRFRKLLDDLPEEVRGLARKQYALFEENPHHPGLNFKKVRDNPPIFSVRVGIHHRALARRVDNDLVWFWIGPHSEYDHLLNRR